MSMQNSVQCGRSMVSGLVKAAVLVFVAVSVGCGARMGQYDIKVAMDPALAALPGGAPSVTVNLVGVNETGMEQWNNKSMQEYWMPRDALRSDAEQKYAYVMQFGPGQPDVKVLKADDPMWAAWKAAGATHVFVLADLPGAFEARPGAADARRRVLPLDTRRWRDNEIDIELQRSSVFVKTEILPEPKK
jgi:hypothetical protein